jgi:hypothetical protein
MSATTTQSALERALTLAGEGFYVFPSWAKDRHIPGWPSRATRDPEQIKAWFSGPYKECWPSIFTGKYGDGEQSLIVVDVDPRGIATAEADSTLPETRVHKTPRGGFHGIYAAPFPGVKSGANVLADGIDIRSKGGLVHFGEGYALDIDAPIAQATADLIAKCGELAPDTAPADRAQDRIAPDQEAALQRAEDFMRTCQRAAEGARNGALRDFVYRVREHCATDADSTLVIGLAFATEHCDPPYPEDEARATIRSAIKSAQNPAGSRVALPEDFPLVVQEQASEVIERAKRPTFIRMADLRAEAVTAKPWLVSGFFQPGTLICLFGEPGAGKSVLCGDLAHAVASGRPWLGEHKTQPGACLYIAYEGFGSMQRRLLALRQQYGDAPVALAPGRFNLAHEDGRKALRQLAADVAAVCGPLALIVFDTWARVLSVAGANENSASEVGRVADALELLAEQTGAAILVVHHSGKQKAAGARGSNALLGAVHTEIEVSDGSIKTCKQRDADEHGQIGFKLVSIPIGTDPAGEIVTAPLPQPAAVSKAGTAKLKGKPALALDALCVLSPNNEPVTNDAWRAACAEFLHPKRRADWTEIKRVLRLAGVTEQPGPDLWARKLYGGE